MPRPQKGSPEAKAWGAKMKAARSANQNNKTDIKQNDDIEQLKAQIEELKKAAFFSQPAPAAPSTKTVHVKHSFDPSIYPDPRTRLAAEDKLKPLAFGYHYELGWNISKWDSEEDGLKIRQPRFELELWRKIPASEGDEFSPPKPARKALVKRGMFFEDPDSYIVIAGQQGVDVPEHLEKSFLDEMRYLSFRDWLFDALWPPKPTNIRKLSEEVIANRLMTTVEMTSDVGGATPAIPWDQMGNKL